MDLVLLATGLIWIPLIPLRLVLHIGIPFWRRLGDLTFWVAVIYWAAVCLFLLAQREWLLDTRFPSHSLVTVVGALITFLFLAFGYWTIRTLGLVTLSTRPQISPQKVSSSLVVVGPYRLVRHPVYFTEWGLLLGLGLVTASWLPLFLLAITLLVDPIVTRFEEKELVERFGNDYSDYQKKVPRLIPCRRTT